MYYFVKTSKMFQCARNLMKRSITRLSLIHIYLFITASFVGFCCTTQISSFENIGFPLCIVSVKNIGCLLYTSVTLATHELFYFEKQCFAYSFQSGSHLPVSYPHLLPIDHINCECFPVEDVLVLFPA